LWGALIDWIGRDGWTDIGGIVEITSLVPGKKYGTVAEYRAGIHGI